MRLKIIDEPETMLSRDAQNEAAHCLTVGLMAYQLQRAFRADPDQTSEAIIEKIFEWLCGKSIGTALKEKDTRLMTREGVGSVRSGLWEQGTGKRTEFDDVRQKNWLRSP